MADEEYNSDLLAECSVFPSSLLERKAEIIVLLFAVNNFACHPETRY